MYLRVRNAFERFLVQRKVSRADSNGRVLVEFKDAGVLFAALDTLRPHEVDKWRALKHQVDVVLIQHGGEAPAQIGDRLIGGARIFLVQHVEPTLGGWHIYYCEERHDL
ncbi:MAG: hypothetical protein IJL12_08895 [Selenomonadaceae bacterium]|nr:hypothetical protein [Selenomonadaceae bacterium]MBQ6132439.1 hypothetical protein [Selenomonadaceae bacterium]